VVRSTLPLLAVAALAAAAAFTPASWLVGLDLEALETRQAALAAGPEAPAATWLARAEAHAPR
jgi:hypothetical protein